MLLRWLAAAVCLVCIAALAARLRSLQCPVDGGGLAAHVQSIVNYELQRRKTFWVDEALAYMLAKTDVVVPGRDLRVPFASFALVFTDRHLLSLGERLLSVERSPLAGHFLQVATVYVTEERRARLSGVVGMAHCLAPGRPSPGGSVDNGP